MRTVIARRPRLKDEVVVRRHVGEIDSVVLHHEASRRVSRILPVQWQVLALADGTRDVEGLVLAARARDIEVEPEDLIAFLGHLAADGLLEEGPAPPAGLDADPDADLLDVPLDPIDGWRFECSGSGVCCHVFPSILFTPLEAARAQVMLPDEPHDFFPVRGGAREGAALAPVLVEGRCRYLDDANRCQLHACGGIDAKPAGCRAFPTQLVFDGERVRVSAAFECACVVDGIGRESGDPPVAPGVETLRGLPRPSRVGRVPDDVAVDEAHRASRAQVRAFYRALADAAPPQDVARGVWSLASAIRARGLDPEVIRAYESPDPSDGAAERELSGMLVESLRRWREPLASFRSSDDLTRRAIDWMIEAGESIERDGLNAGAAPQLGSRCAAVESFYVRATAWVCRDALGPLPLATALHVRALRVWLARALAAVAGADPRARAPLALVEVMFRAHGLDAFVGG